MSNKLDSHRYFFELPLYSRIKCESNEFDEFNTLINTIHNVNAYNPDLKENTTYEVRPNVTIGGQPSFNSFNGIRTNTLRCLRTKKDFYVYSFFDAEVQELQKVGQYVSIADIHISQIKAYDKVLSKDLLKEFTRAIGLAANGVGIGSYVYLRRIFESLLEDAHMFVLSDAEWNEDEYQRLRVSDKIVALKRYLPSFLVENKSLYGILSKGIHELKEEECLEYFDTVKLGIELILDEKLVEYEKAKKISDATNRISVITSKLKRECT